MLTKTRFNQLSELHKEVKQDNPDLHDKKRIFKDTTLWYIQDKIKQENKNKKTELESFVNNYIWSLQKEQLDLIWNKIMNYTSLLEESTYFQYNQDIFSNKLLQIMQYPDDFSIKDVMFELLYNFVFLPEYENKEQFEKDMISIIDNLDNFVYKFFDGYELQFKTLNTLRVWDIIQQTKWEEGIYSTLNVNHEFVEKVTYFVDLPAYTKSRVNELWNEISITYLLKYDMFEINLREEIIKLLENEVEKWNLSKDLEWNYLFWNYPELSIHLEVSMDGLSWLEEYNGKEYFELRIYTKPKAFSLEWSYYDYINYSNMYLTWVATDIATYFSKKGIYNSIAWEIVSKILSKKLSKKDIKKIKEKLEIYLDAEKVEKIIKLLKSEKNMDAVKKLTQYFNKKVGKIYPKPTTLLDFNDGIEDTWERVSKEQEQTENWETKEKKTALEKIVPGDLLDHIILDDKTKNWLELIKNYLKNKDEKDKQLLKPFKWAIFYWKPGLGKTESVKHIAKETWFDVYTINLSKLLDMYVWESEKIIEQSFNDFFEVLEKDKAILFIDEADGFFGKKGDEVNKYKQWIRSIVLEKIEWFSTNPALKNGFIILSTNFSQDIDKALKERLWLYVEFKMPTKEKRLEFFSTMKKYFEEEKWIMFDFDLNEIVSKTSDFSYRELTSLLNQAILISNWNTIKLEDLLNSLWYIKEQTENNTRSMWFQP